MYTISKEFQFSYGHRVWRQQLHTDLSCNASCKCRFLHGHNGSVNISLSAKTLNNKGMVIDFNELNWLKQWIDYVLDHKFVFDISDPMLKLFLESNPNCKTSLADVYRELAILLGRYHKEPKKYENEVFEQLTNYNLDFVLSETDMELPDITSELNKTESILNKLIETLDDIYSGKLKFAQPRYFHKNDEQRTNEFSVHSVIDELKDEYIMVEPTVSDHILSYLIKAIKPTSESIMCLLNKLPYKDLKHHPEKYYTVEKRIEPLVFNSYLTEHGKPPKQLEFKQYLNELFEGLTIVDFIPTSENFAKWIYDVVSNKMKPHGITVQSVEFKETPKTSSCYIGND